VSATGPTPRLPAAERRRQLLDTARTLFAERGFHTTAMNDIADAAGVTKPVLYQHFSSKRDLYRAVVEDVGGRLEDTIAKAAAGAPGPREQVEAGMVAYFRFVADESESFEVLFGGETRRDPEFVRLVAATEASIAAAVAGLITIDGIDAEHQSLLGHALVGLAEGASRRWLASGRQEDPELLAHRVAEMAWAGLRGVRS
jgi:AcrR family transcriptional regulator